MRATIGSCDSHGTVNGASLLNTVSTASVIQTLPSLPVLPSGPARLHGLDGLRAIAVAMVVWHNWGPLPFTHRFGNVGDLRAGFVGVTLFFVLSGFLITTVLLRDLDIHRRLRYREFYVRRAFRLLPALFVALAVLTVLGLRNHQQWKTIGLGVISSLAYVYNLASAAKTTKFLDASGWGHLWSLSVEEQFYVGWPMAMGFFVRRISAKTATKMLFGLVATITIWRTWLWSRNASFGRLYLMTDVRIDAIVLGVAMAVAFRAFPLLRTRAVKFHFMLFPLLSALAALAYFGSSAHPSKRPGWLIGPGMILASIISALCIWISSTGTGGLTQRVLDSRSLTAIGRRSYGIYLFHLPALAMAGKWSDGWLWSLLITAALTEASYQLVERPVLKRLPAWAR